MGTKSDESVRERRKEKVVFAQRLGVHLRKVRKEKNVSQEDLSMDAGYYRTYVGKIEQGKYSPSTHTIWRLAKTLGLGLQEFFKDFR